MGWGGAGKNSWNNSGGGKGYQSYGNEPNNNGGNGGGEKVAWSLVYKEREKLAEVQALLHEKESKEERAKELADLERRLKASLKPAGPGTMESTIRSMAMGSSGEAAKRHDDEPEEQQGMVTSIWQTLKRLATREHAGGKAKQSRKKSSSAASSSSAEKKRKKKQEATHKQRKEKKHGHTKEKSKHKSANKRVRMPVSEGDVQ
jgi:hypothetical protein